MSIQFHAVEPRSSVRDRLRREGVDSKLGGVNRFTTVADVIDHFLSESLPSATAIKSSLQIEHLLTAFNALRQSHPSSACGLLPTTAPSRSRPNTTGPCLRRESKEK